MHGKMFCQNTLLCIDNKHQFKTKILFHITPLSGCALLITLVILSRSSFLVYRETSQLSLDPECEDKMILN